MKTQFNRYTRLGLLFLAAGGITRIASDLLSARAMVANGFAHSVVGFFFGAAVPLMVAGLWARRFDARCVDPD